MAHRTNAVYKRYNIIDEDLQRQSLERVAEHQKLERLFEAFGQFSDKKAVFQEITQLTLIGQAFNGKPMSRGKPLNEQERVGGEGGI